MGRTDAVSDVFAFVLTNGELSDELLFASEEIPELSSVEKAAIDAARPHVEESWSALLTSCRTEIFALAGDVPEFATLRKWENRPQTIFGRGYVEMYLREKPQADGAVGFSLQLVGGQYHLIGWVWGQKRWLQLLHRAASECAAEVEFDDEDGSCYVDAGVPAQGVRFDDLAKPLAARVWPVAQTFRRLLGKKEEGRTATNAEEA